MHSIINVTMAMQSVCKIVQFVRQCIGKPIRIKGIALVVPCFNESMYPIQNILENFARIIIIEIYITLLAYVNVILDIISCLLIKCFHKRLKRLKS